MPSSKLFSRTQRIVGEAVMERLSAVRVILFGVGGVGSWTAECLVRTGVRHLTIVDPDIVQATNINRQLMATSQNIGHSKVEELRQRLHSIHPQAEIEAISEAFSPENAERFRLDTYDYIIDAIDSLTDKVALILQATHTSATVLSSMGAALKLDPTRVHVAEFWKVQGCPLAAALRRRFRKLHTFPEKKFRCVYSDELLPNLGHGYTSEPLRSDTAEAEAPVDRNLRKAQINGSLAHITGIFGLTLAGLLVQDLYNTSTADR